MRADRLLAILLILQNRGRVTAQRLADELEVSVRTIYRDIDALCVAGVPVYTDRGPGGGISILDSYQTDLSGLTEDEMRALFLLTIPTPLVELGLTQQLKGALLKLRAALPVAGNINVNSAQQRLHLDWVGWQNIDKNSPHLLSLQEGVWHNRLVNIHYRSVIHNHIIDLTLAPYSLVAKAGTWYLIGASKTRIRVYRVSSITDVVVLAGEFERPVSYNLLKFWQNWCALYKENRTNYQVLARIDPTLIPYLNHVLGEQSITRLGDSASPSVDNWIDVKLMFESFEIARGHVLNCGRAIEIIEPQALRAAIIDYAEQIITFNNHSE